MHGDKKNLRCPTAATLKLIPTIIQSIGNHLTFCKLIDNHYIASGCFWYQSHISQFNKDASPHSIWCEILVEVQNFNQNAGTITLDTLTPSVSVVLIGPVIKAITSFPLDYISSLSIFTCLIMTLQKRKVLFYHFCNPIFHNSISCES
jgi:hypothetical protein